MKEEMITNNVDWNYGLCYCNADCCNRRNASSLLKLINFVLHALSVFLGCSEKNSDHRRTRCDRHPLLALED